MVLHEKRLHGLAARFWRRWLDDHGAVVGWHMFGQESIVRCVRRVAPFDHAWIALSCRANGSEPSATLQQLT
jgi:hypothetical protein